MCVCWGRGVGWEGGLRALTASLPWPPGQRVSVRIKRGVVVVSPDRGTYLLRKQF